jgi:hypothetical protein
VAADARGDAERATADADGPAPVCPVPLDPQPATDAITATTAMPHTAALENVPPPRVVRLVTVFLAMALSCREPGLVIFAACEEAAGRFCSAEALRC